MPPVRPVAGWAFLLVVVLVHVATCGWVPGAVAPFWCLRLGTRSCPRGGSCGIPPTWCNPTARRARHPGRRHRPRARHPGRPPGSGPPQRTHQQQDRGPECQACPGIRQQQATAPCSDFPFFFKAAPAAPEPGDRHQVIQSRQQNRHALAGRAGLRDGARRFPLQPGRGVVLRLPEWRETDVWGPWGPACW